MKKRIAVLGCGRIGAAIARDLAGDNDLEVCVFDASEKNLASVRASATVRTEIADLADIPALSAKLTPFDAVAGALPSRLGFDALKAIAGLGKPCGYLLHDRGPAPVGRPRPSERRDDRL